MPLKNRVVISHWSATPSGPDEALRTHLQSRGWTVTMVHGSVSGQNWDDVSWLFVMLDHANNTAFLTHPDDALFSTYPVNICTTHNRTGVALGLALRVYNWGLTSPFDRQITNAKNVYASLSMASTENRQFIGIDTSTESWPVGANNNYSRMASALQISCLVDSVVDGYSRVFFSEYRFDTINANALTTFDNYIGEVPVALTRSIFAAGGNYLANIDPVTLLQRWREPHPAHPDNSFVLTVMAVDRDEACVTLVGQNTFSEVGPDGLGVITSYSSGGVERWLDTYEGTLWGIAIDFTNGDIVVVGVPDGAGHGIRKYNRNGQLLWGVTGHPNPRCVAVRPFDGSIYVAGTGGTPVQKYDSSGQLVMTSATTPGFASSDVWYGIDVHNDTGKFVVGIFTGFVDPYPGVQMFNADGTLDWADTLTIALSVAFDQNSGDVYAAGIGALDVRPAVRKYDSAGVAQWDVNMTATVVHIGWDPATSHVLLTANLNPGGEDLWYAIRLNTLGGNVSQWNYDFWPYANVIVGSEYVEHPTRAAITNLTPTSATFEWEPPG